MNQLGVFFFFLASFLKNLYFVNANRKVTDLGSSPFFNRWSVWVVKKCPPSISCVQGEEVSPSLVLKTPIQAAGP